MKSYKFFHGFDRQRRVTWIIDEGGYRDENLLGDLTEQFQRAIDDEIVNQVVRRVNGGGQDNLQYLNHYINMEGGNRA